MDALANNIKIIEELSISLFVLVIRYAYYITIWYAAICIIKGYHKRHIEDQPPRLFRFLFKKTKVTQGEEK